MKKKLLISMLSLSLFATPAFGASNFAYANTTDLEDNAPLVIAPAPSQSQVSQNTQITDDILENAALTAKDTAAKAADKANTGKTSAKTSTASKKNSASKAASKKKNPTAKQVLKSLKKSLGKSYTSDQKETKERLESYWDLDMKKVASWAAETNSNSMQSDCTIVLKVKKGYAKKAAAKLQNGYEQILSYNRMYNMDTQRVLQARLYVNGNYIALIIEGQQPDYNDSAEAQAKFAAKEGNKIDKAWKKIFGSAKNKIKIPKDDDRQKGFDMSELADSAQ